MTPHLRLYLEWWYIAKDQPLGIWIRTTNYHQLMTKLYLARKEAQDPSLSNLQLKRSPRDPENELWLCNLPEPEVADIDLKDLMRA